MKMILTLTVAAIALGATAQQPSLARGALPWCEIGSMSGGDLGNCNFYTFEQCMKTAWGDGRCTRNPRFDAPYFQRGIPAPVDIDPFGRPPQPYRK